MKYIFDFDDVLLFTSRRREEHLIPHLTKLGFSREEIEAYYQKTRSTGFSMRKFLNHFSGKQDLYEEIMNGIEEYANTDVIEVVKKLGKENCYIVTYGDKEFQLEKIEKLGLMDLFSKIVTVPKEYKKEEIEKICTRHKDEQVFFIDDKQRHFDELDMQSCPNLKTILYTGQDLSPLFI